MSDHIPRETFARYLAGDLSLDEVRALESHVASCSICARALEAIVDEERLLEDLARSRPPVTRRWVTAARVVGPVVALAAALMVAVWPQPSPPPAFDVSVDGQLGQLRGGPAPDADLRFQVGGKVTVVLQPTEDAGALDVRVFDVWQDARVPVAAQITTAPHENTRVVVTLTEGSPQARVGDHALWVALAPAGARLDASELSDAEVQGPWRVVQVAYRVQDQVESQP